MAGCGTASGGAVRHRDAAHGRLRPVAQPARRPSPGQPAGGDNHGGRQLDGALSSVAALPAIVDAVGTSVEVHLDGGIRSGQDVVKALALGANDYLGKPYDEQALLALVKLHATSVSASA